MRQAGGRDAHQVHGVEDLHLSHGAGAGVGHVAVVHARGQRAQAARVGRRVADGVEDLHVADVVDVQRLLQTHDEPLQQTQVERGARRARGSRCGTYRSVELHCEDGVAIAVVTYLGTLLVMAYYQLSVNNHILSGPQN